jgi:hypothetical protein
MTSVSTASLHDKLHSDDWLNCLWGDVPDCKKAFLRETGRTKIKQK